MSWLIFDAVLGIVLVLAAVQGYRKGFVLTLCGFLAVFVAFFGASVLSNALAGPVAEAIRPVVEERLEQAMQKSLEEQGWSDGEGEQPEDGSQTPAPEDQFSLEQVLDLGPENVTVHTLALKKGSRLMEEGGGLPSGAAVADMLDFAWAALRGAGQRPYYLYRQKYMSGSFENVGWCRPGAESLYNICMMEELHTIVSLGGGGVTKLVDRATGYIERLANAKYPQEYIQKIDAICADKGRVAQFYAAHGR